jgi:hypothetical protein
MQLCKASRKEPEMTVVYVVTTDGRDAYADMALVSALSVRASNPRLRIAIIGDAQSVDALKAKKHRLLQVVDELRAVKAPYESAVHRNRSIKTRLYEFFQGPAVNLDVDTLVKGSLESLLKHSHEFGAVANHNGPTPKEQLWSEDATTLSEMGWKTELPCYINTGVIFYRPGHRVEQFYSKWRELWADECKRTGRGRDQPSCYEALSKTTLQNIELPTEFNFQLNMHDGDASNAVVWHFYKGTHTKPTIFEELVHLASRESLATLRTRIKRTITMPFPWPNTDYVARRLARRISGKRLPTTAEYLWLTGSRRAASRTALSDLKAWVVKSRGRPQ